MSKKKKKKSQESGMDRVAVGCTIIVAKNAISTTTIIVALCKAKRAPKGVYPLHKPFAKKVAS
jgi:hypothetical protein